MKLIEENGATVEYQPGFLSEGERDLLVSEFEATAEQFAQDRFTMYGKTVMSPRLVCAFGDPGLAYRYSGVDRSTQAWIPSLEKIRDRLSVIASQPFNYALVNLYRNGRDYVGWHADDEADIVPHSTIASLSLGAVRPFQLRRKDRSSSEVHEILLGDGSLLLMSGTTQRLFNHQLPVRKGVQGKRYNVTFRSIRRAP